MGGMTLGYLHPPQRTRKNETGEQIKTEIADLDHSVEKHFIENHAPIFQATGERTLMWARRIFW
jgi:hypothetical protein